MIRAAGRLPNDQCGNVPNAAGTVGGGAALDAIEQQAGGVAADFLEILPHGRETGSQQAGFGNVGIAEDGNVNADRKFQGGGGFKGMGREHVADGK